MAKDLYDELMEKIAGNQIKLEELEKLNERENRILGYFWKDKTKIVIESISVDAILYLEYSCSPGMKQQLVNTATEAAIYGLQNKGCLQISNIELYEKIGHRGELVECATLTRKGHEKLYSRHFHPTVWWGRMLYSLPNWVTLAYTIFMTALAILGLIFAFPKPQTWLSNMF